MDTEIKNLTENAELRSLLESQTFRSVVRLTVSNKRNVGAKYNRITVRLISL